MATTAIIFLIWTISTIQPLQALSPHILRADKTMQNITKITKTYMAARAFLPLPILGVLVAFYKFGIAGPGDLTNHGTGKRSHRYNPRQWFGSPQSRQVTDVWSLTSRALEWRVDGEPAPQVITPLTSSPYSSPSSSMASQKLIRNPGSQRTTPGPRKK